MLPLVTTNQSSTAIVKPNENKETEKLPALWTKQLSGLNYDRPTVLPMMAGEKQIPSWDGEMGARAVLVSSEKRESNTTKTLGQVTRPDSTDYNETNRNGRSRNCKALEDGDRQKPNDWAKSKVGPNNSQYGRYLAFGDVSMVFNNQKRVWYATDYHRGLDITAEATTTTSYTQDGIT